MAFLKRLIRALPLLALSPLFMAISFVALLAAQVFTRKGGRLAADSAKTGGARKSELRSDGQVGGLSYCSAASVVIPNWNGKDLLAKYIPSVRTALPGNPANEILVWDNGSSDGR